MILKDRVIHGWIGDAADVLHYPLPVALAVGITLLGWWFARGQHRRKKIPENA